MKIAWWRRRPTAECPCGKRHRNYELSYAPMLFCSDRCKQVFYAGYDVMRAFYALEQDDAPPEKRVGYDTQSGRPRITLWQKLVN